MTVTRRLSADSRSDEAGSEDATKPWSAAMLQFLLRMRRRGKAYGWIARALGRTRAECVERAMKAGLLARQTPGPSVPIADEPEPIGPVKEILGDGVCHWICDEGGKGDWRMCGHPGVDGSTWCAHHRRRVYQPTVLAELTSPNRWIAR